MNSPAKVTVDILKTKFYPVDVLRQAIFLVPKDRERDIAYRWSRDSYICIGLRGARLMEHTCYRTFTRVPAMLRGIHESDWGGGITVSTSCAVCLDTGKIDLMDLSEECRCALADDLGFQSQRIVIGGRAIPLQQSRSRWPVVADLAALRLLALEVVTDIEKAKALGFDSVEAMREHGAWLGRHGTLEYKHWAASIARSSGATVPGGNEIHF